MEDMENRVRFQNNYPHLQVLPFGWICGRVLADAQGLLIGSCIFYGVSRPFGFRRQMEIDRN